ncbi:hypothetical protein B0H13DRAFT_1910288 [Mycena leptocephala]|nr:hypothetical protein B0H13DRAFT_1910288 [Mycena leptocephala]
MARIDLGVEPAHMPDFFSIFMNGSMENANMKGLLQMADLTPKSIWRQARENGDWMGFEANSVGLMEFRNRPSQQSITCTAHITQAAMDLVRESLPWQTMSCFCDSSPNWSRVPATSIQSVAVYTLCTHTRADTATAQNLGSGCVVQDTSQLMGHGPLLVKALIDFAKARAAGKAAGVEPANIGHGISMVFGLLIVIVLASICQHQFLFRSMMTGVLARTALTGPVPLHRWFHVAWTALIQTTVCLIILLVELGPSALAGFALFLLIIPLQERIIAHRFSLWQAGMKWMDKRAERVLEVGDPAFAERKLFFHPALSSPSEYISDPGAVYRHLYFMPIHCALPFFIIRVGERSLLSLARALVKDSRMVILDEATYVNSIALNTQFKDRTLICIAYRLRTIILYDRILVGACTVLDAGKKAEFDTPLNLFNRNESLFRSLCDKSNITSGDIEKAIISDDVE